MKYVKMLGLLAVAAAALMAFAGTASATLTSPAGTAYAGNIVATSTNMEIDGAVDVKCANSTTESDPSSAGATGGNNTFGSFTNCGSDTVTELANGTYTITSNGTVFSTGKRFTVTWHRVIFFVPITTHCLWETNNTHWGVLTENIKPPVMHVTGNIPLVPTDGACGENAEITGRYTINTPNSAIVVD